jgi:uncharacterized protein YegJ (DUF2314 family)
VKLPLREGETVEHVWISDVRFDGGRFYGRIDNDVQSVKGWRLGDTVSVPADSISDWLIVDDCTRRSDGWLMPARLRAVARPPSIS